LTHILILVRMVDNQAVVTLHRNIASLILNNLLKTNFIMILVFLYYKDVILSEVYYEKSRTNTKNIGENRSNLDK